MYFKKLIILTFILITMLITSIVLLITIPGPQAEFITYPGIGYYPGDQHPTMNQCYPMESPLVYCSFDLVSFVYDAADHEIESSSVLQDNLSVGYLISKWGEPTSSNYYKGRIDLVFGLKKAIILTENYSPVSKVLLINFDLRTPNFTPYKGFFSNTPQ